MEDRLRRAWIGRARPAMRGAAAIFGVAALGRLFLYELGLIRARPSPVPVVSVGGLTVGGSGKTPIASAIARWLLEAGHRPAIVTSGPTDERDVHRHLLPDIFVFATRDRGAAVREAAGRGAQSIILDDGFSHRRLHRVLDLLLLDADALIRTNCRCLPAGPFRHPLRSAALADALVVTRRAADDEPSRRVAARLARDGTGRPVGRCALRCGRLRAVNEAARSVASPRPAVAVAGIMKPRLFFEAVHTRWPHVVRRHSFRDHRGATGSELDALVRDAATRGILCTLKDAVRLGPRVGERTPLWYVEERVEWERGAVEIRAMVLARTAQAPRQRGGTRWRS